MRLPNRRYSRRSGLRWSALLFTLAIAGALGPGGPEGQSPRAPKRSSDVKVIEAVRTGVSPEARSLAPARPVPPGVIREIPRPKDPRPISPAAAPVPQPDPYLQSENGRGNGGLPLTIDQNFAGTPNVFGVLPPDTQGDVGPDHYVQWVNLGFSMFDKSGTLLVGPLAGNALFTGFGGPCETQNNGDPITLYDHLADRWLMSQFALLAPDGNHQCVAISVTGDPTGAYFLYDFLWGPLVNDYPKFGVWPDGYYLSVNQFTPSFAFAGAGVAVMERDRMLHGLPARMIQFGTSSELIDFFALLPAHLEGPPPPAGSPNYFLSLLADEFGYAADSLQFWEFAVDWADPKASTFTPTTTLPTGAFDAIVCLDSFGFLVRDCVPQSGTAQGVDAIEGQAMYRAQYRNFGSHESIVVTSTVDADAVANEPGSKGRAGQRWYELRDPGGTPVIHQEGVYAPLGLHRWMGSMAMDGDGNIALGHSGSSASDFPSIRFTGRRAGDPLGTMTETEQTLRAGTGSQTHPAARWGDYSTMSVDPSDDCTFWYTTEYLETTSEADWVTRIGSFRFPDCAGTPFGALEGTVDSSGGGPVAGAQVTAGAYSTTTAPDGSYSFPRLPAGAYDMSVSSYGFGAGAATAVPVVAGETTVQDFTLAALPFSNVDGFVTDAAGGWGLYAKIEIAAEGFFETVLTDPLDGSYLVSLANGVDHDFTVTALVPGYAPAQAGVTPPTSQNFALTADEGCTAPGYELTAALAETFESGLPSGWSVVINADPAAGWRFDDPGSRGNRTGGSGGFAIADSDFFGLVTMDTELRTPVIDLSGFSGVTLRFRTDFLSYNGYYDLLDEIADVDLSTNGGSSYTNVFRRQEADGNLFATAVAVPLPAADGQSSVVLRFHFYNSYYDFWWQIDDVEVGTCDQLANAGLVIGHTYDANTNQPIDGALVSDTAGHSTVTAPTPLDPGRPDGFYVLGTSGPAQTLTATKPLYGPAKTAVVVTVGGVTEQDFDLPAGLLEADPRAIAQSPDSVRNYHLVVRNEGGAALAYELFEKNYPVPPVRVAERTHRAGGPQQGGVHLPAAPRRPGSTPPAALHRGAVGTSFLSGLAASYGISFDLERHQVWIGNIAVAGGDDRDYLFLPSGLSTGLTIDLSSFVGVFAADLTYNINTSTLWQVDVGGDNCIHELDPVARQVTGNTICPPFPNSQRGLAYDPLTDTYYSGSFEDNVVHQFTSAGDILRSVQTAIPVTGLAFNPATGHLFALESDPVEVSNGFVLDAQTPDLDVLASFTLSDGINTLQDAGAGLALDCNDSIWATDFFTNRVFVVPSGETGVCDFLDIPWLSIGSPTGAIPAAASVNVAFTIDTTGLALGTYPAHLLISNDTPYGPVAVSIELEVVDPLVFADGFESGDTSAWSRSVP